LVEPVLIRQIDPVEDPQAMAAVLPVAQAVLQEQLPGHPLARETRLRMWCSQGYHTHVKTFAAFDSADAQAADGVLLFEWEDDANEDLATVSIWVAQRARRRGIGSALLATAQREGARLGCTRLAGNASSAAPATEFAARHGARSVQSVARSVLDLGTVSRDRMAASAQPSAANAHYRLVRWTDSCPAEHLASFGAAMAAMNDAPQGDFGLEHPVCDPERQRGREEQSIRAGVVRRVLMALDPRDEVAGFTIFAAAPDEPEGLDIWDTGVPRAHRGHGLGLRLKAAQTLWMLEEHPRATSVHTFNDAENEHMLAVNRALGYRRAETFSWYQAPIQQSAGTD
jgi:GNAT superfamily N-acetyltransferase